MVWFLGLGLGRVISFFYNNKNMSTTGSNNCAISVPPVFLKKDIINGSFLPFTPPDIKSCRVVPPAVTFQDFQKALRTTRPSVCEEDLQEHVKFTQDYGQEG